MPILQMSRVSGGWGGEWWGAGGSTVKMGSQGSMAPTHLSHLPAVGASLPDPTALSTSTLSPRLWSHQPPRLYPEEAPALG